MRDNTYYNFLDAVKAAEQIVGEDRLLVDNAGTKWDCFNLMDYPDSRPVDGDEYWCVSHDGYIGYTVDNGYNVEWIYSPGRLAEAERRKNEKL